jgi:hypothetical protein
MLFFLFLRHSFLTYTKYLLDGHHLILDYFITLLYDFDFFRVCHSHELLLSF